MEENLQNEELDKDLCGGKKKPIAPIGEVGDYVCEDGVWVWVPAT